MIKKKTSAYFWIALLGSIGFVAGIVMTIFGATNSKTIILVAGIILIVFGFYGAPIFWIKYGELKSYSQICQKVQNGINTISLLCSSTGKDEKTVRDTINICLQNNYLPNYVLIKNEYIVKAEGIKQFEAKDIATLQGNVTRQKCNQCGAEIVFDGTTRVVCPYCGATNLVETKQPQNNNKWE